METPIGVFIESSCWLALFVLWLTTAGTLWLAFAVTDKLVVRVLRSVGVWGDCVQFLIIRYRSKRPAAGIRLARIWEKKFESRRGEG